MSGSANVRSVAAISAAKSALSSFADQVEQALAMIEVESRRMLDWLQHDRPRHWRNQIRLANDELAEARAALQRCLMYPLSGERPSCHEERAALKRAQARLAYCEEKAERLRHWKREIEHELFQYQGRISQLVRLVEIDVPQAEDLLKKLLDRLEEYRAVRMASSEKGYDDVALAAQLWPEQAGAGAEQEDPTEANEDNSEANPQPEGEGNQDTTALRTDATGVRARLLPHPSPLPEGEGTDAEGARR